MSIFKKILEEQYLVEITLQDHYKQYITPKFDIPFEEYETIAKLDPTSSDNRKGKYVDWIIKTFLKPDGTWDVKKTYMNNVKQALNKFINKPVDINQFKSYEDLQAYVETIPEKSNRQIKKEKKDIFNSPDDIKVIDNTDEWICIQTLTKEGNILGAQYKTDPQAKWCTAYLNEHNMFNNYDRRGALLQFINKADPYEKYQVLIEDKRGYSGGVITESRDYDDRTSSVPHKLIKNELPNFETNFGSIEKQEPYKFIWDEEGAAAYLFSENFDNEWDYLNRQPDEDDYDDYYEEAVRNEEFQINHWDRFLREAYNIYKEVVETNTRRKRNGFSYSNYELERFDNISGYFLNPITGIEDDKPYAKEAIIDMYEEFDEEWNDYVEENSEHYIDEEEREQELEKLNFDFLHEESTRWSFIQLFQDDFPYNFSFGEGGRDNSDEQMSFNFEAKLNKMLANLVEEELIDDTIPEGDEYNDEGLVDDTIQDTVEEEPEEEIEESTRLLGIDKRKCNKELKELLLEPVTAIPFSKIKDVLKKYNIAILETEDKKFIGKDGNIDFDILINNKAVSNSCLVVYWSKQDTDNLININVYLS